MHLLEGSITVGEIDRLLGPAHGMSPTAHCSFAMQEKP
jgi:hypothetical protein